MALLLPAAPTRAQSSPELADAVDAYSAPDVTSSTVASATGTTAAAGRRVPEIPVGATGSYATGVDIAVPPGRHGMQPSLGLTYSSAASQEDSPVGAGWA